MYFYYIHAYSHNITFMMHLFDIPFHGKFAYMYYLLYLLSNKWIRCYMDCRADLQSPDPCSFYPTFYSLAPLFVHFALCFTHYQDKSADAIKNSMHDVVNVQSLVIRHQVVMLQAKWSVHDHAALINWYTALSVQHAAPSHYCQHLALGICMLC